MYRLKSIFLSTAIFYWLSVSIWALVNGISSGSLNYGLLLTALLPTLFIGWLFVFRTARTSADLKPITFIIVGAYALSFERLIHDNQAWLPVLLSSIAVGFWAVYLRWYSAFKKRDSEQLKIGAKLPKLYFIDIDGKEISTHKFKGKKMILLFYRGNWCPLCMAQIKEISDQYRELKALGAEVLLISPQPHKFTISLAKKRAVDLHFLQDKDNRVAQALSIYAKGGTPFGLEVLGFESDTVLPTVIITDENGRIIFADQTDNYRVRPEPQTFLRVLKGV